MRNICFFILMFFFSCTSTDKPAEAKTESVNNQADTALKGKASINLTGKVYSYGSDVGIHSCYASPPIGDVRCFYYFFSDSQFVYQSDSPGVLLLSKGQYRLSNDKLGLFFDAESLVGEEDMQTGKISLNKEMRSPDTLQFDLAQCNKGFYFITGDTVDRYLAQDEGYLDGAEFQIRLQESKYWEMLGLKNRTFPPRDRTPKVIREFHD